MRYLLVTFFVTFSLVMMSHQAKANEDLDTVMWTEAQKGNSVEDYQVYLDSFPKGKYSPFAKARIKKIQDASEQQEQQAWENAQKENSEISFGLYLKAYPSGRFAGLAKERLLNKDASAKEGEIIRDCADCPEMVVIPTGSFIMGSSQVANETKNIADELPAHTVTFMQSFAMGKTEVTQGQWEAIMGSPWPYQNFGQCGDNCPVDDVSWYDAQKFIQKLSAKTGKQYRLPSEAEWEYSCLAGGRQEYCGGDNLDSIAWYHSNSNNITHSSAQKQANAFGLYDMSGNLFEWTEDAYHKNYIGAPIDGSVWQGDSEKRVLRGGSWDNFARRQRAAYRFSDSPSSRDNSTGFRLARTLQ